MLLTLIFCFLEPQFAVDAGVILTMNEREVIHNGRLMVDDVGNIVRVGRQTDFEIPSNYIHYKFPLGNFSK